MEGIHSKYIIYLNKYVLIRPRNVHNVMTIKKNLLAERPSVTLSRSSRGGSNIKNRLFRSHGLGRIVA